MKSASMMVPPDDVCAQLVAPPKKGMQPAKTLMTGIAIAQLATGIAVAEVQKMSPAVMRGSEIKGARAHSPVKDFRTAPIITPPADEEAKVPDVAEEFGSLGLAAIINEAALAKLFGKRTGSIKRAVARGELPAPMRLLGGNAWTAGAIVRHIEMRLEAAAKEAEMIGRPSQRGVFA